MTTLTNYHSFIGRHWETGSVTNVYHHLGLKTPHTGQAPSEALLMGISGGAVMGYFSFAYEGHDPQCNILTRNTFDPWDTMLARLGIIQEIKQTNSKTKAVQNLLNCLENGVPAIIWADVWSLPYTALSAQDDMWAMMPLVVYGYDTADDLVHIADRAAVPLTVSTDTLAQARGRVKKQKHRLITLSQPRWEKLATAVQMGIHDCLKLYTENPPRRLGKNSFGLAAYQKWATLLTKPTGKQSWAKVFPAGRKLFAGLLSAYNFAFLFGKHGRAERDTYATFLTEAAQILQKPILNEAATHFRRAGEAWHTFSQQLLPDEIEPFGRARQLMEEDKQLFTQHGRQSLDRRLAIRQQLDDLKTHMERDFPLDSSQVTTLQNQLAEQLLHIRDIEQTAVQHLQTAIT